MVKYVQEQKHTQVEMKNRKSPNRGQIKYISMAVWDRRRLSLNTEQLVLFVKYSHHTMSIKRIAHLVTEAISRIFYGSFMIYPTILRYSYEYL